jgi:hypothetical protein
MIYTTELILDKTQVVYNFKYKESMIQSKYK